MNIFIAIITWLFLGWLIDFIFSMIIASIAYKEKNKQWGCSPWGISASILRMGIILYLITLFTGANINSPLIYSIVIADVAWTLLMVFFLSQRLEPNNNIAMLKTGKSIGSIIFAVAFFILMWVN